MALTDNQLDSHFQSQIGRAPTPYEVSTYSTASPQTIANLKNTYSSYNTENSIVDYLKSIGQDPNDRFALGQKYGIANVGTAEGNTALLKALKAGTPPPTTPPVPVQGTVTPAVATPTVTPAPTSTDASATIPPASTTTPSTTDTTPATSTTDTTGTATGSISGAAGSSTTTPAVTDPNNPLSDPTIQSYQKAYIDAQSQVSQIDSQIASLQNSINNSLQEELASAHASGAPVDEAQITAQVYQTNQALTSEINTLRAARTSAAATQATAGKTYQDAITAFKDAATIDQGQEKIDQTSDKNAATETYQQGELALKAAGLDTTQWKPEQVSVYQDGQVVGKQWVAINASTGQIQSLAGSAATTNGSGTPGASSGATADDGTVAGVNFGASSTIGAYAKDPNYASEVSSVYNDIQNSGLNFQSPEDIQTYITNNAPNSPVTGNMVLAAARQYGVDPALLAAVFEHESNFGTTGAGAKTNNPGNQGNTGSSTKSFATIQDGINATAANLQKRVDYGDPDMNIAYSLATGQMAPSEASKRAASYTNVLNDANTISEQLYGKPFSAAASDADYKYASAPATQNTLNYLASLVGVDGKSGNLAQLVAQSNALPRTQFPALNNTEAWAKLEAGDPAYASYYATLTEVSDQVAKILQGGSGSGGTSDAKLAQASALFDKGFNPSQISAVASDLQGLLGNRAAALVGTNPFLQNMYGGLTALSDSSSNSASSFTPRGSTDAKTFVASTFANLYPGQTEASITAQYKSQLQPGEQLAFDNTTGAVVAVNPKTDDMSKYTPL